MKNWTDRYICYSTVMHHHHTECITHYDCLALFDLGCVLILAKTRSIVVFY